MRFLATLLLAGVAVLFVAASIGAARYPDLASPLGYVRAFAEASVVGACADWFAVVALFRHPLGLPIPHTAIVPHSKLRISQTVGGFVIDNFLSPSVLTARLARLDIAGWLTRWLERPGNVASAATELAGIAPPLAELLDRPDVHDALADAARRALDAIPAAPVAGRTLLLLVDAGFIAKLADWMIDRGSGALMKNSDFVREQVRRNTWSWMPKWLDDQLADRMLVSLRSGLDDMQNPSHAWRGALEREARSLAARLTEDPAMAADGERIKTELLSHPDIALYLNPILRAAEDRLKSGAADNALVRTGIEKALQSMARLLRDDLAAAARLNEWLRGAIERVLAPNRVAIAAFIGETVSGWDDETLVSKIELQVGRDLQYIRINGTVVGGLVGLAIFSASRIAEHFHLLDFLRHATF